MMPLKLVQVGSTVERKAERNGAQLHDASHVIDKSDLVLYIRFKKKGVIICDAKARVANPILIPFC